MTVIHAHEQQENKIPTRKPNSLTECSPWTSLRVANAEESVNILDTVCLQAKVWNDLNIKLSNLIKKWYPSKHRCQQSTQLNTSWLPSMRYLLIVLVYDPIWCSSLDIGSPNLGRHRARWVCVHGLPFDDVRHKSVGVLDGGHHHDHVRNDCTLVLVTSRNSRRVEQRQQLTRKRAVKKGLL